MISEDDVQVSAHKLELEKIRQERIDNDNKERSHSNGRSSEDRVGRSSPTTRGIEESVTGTPNGTQGTTEIDGPLKRLRKRIRPTNGETLDTTQSNRSDDTRPQKPLEPVKLLTQTEVDEQRDHLVEVYLFLSSLPDDFLEIMVRDHEPVQIWQMSSEEAETFADMRLAQAKKNPAVAREVRKLLEIYDRMYFYMYLYPRLIATGRHISDHRGFSFK